MTNLEYWLGTPEKAAAVIWRLRFPRVGNNHIPDGFELAWLDWYSERWLDADPEDMPSPTECMAQFLRAEHK